MLNGYLDKIDFLHGYTNVEAITQGHSAIAKYKVELDGKMFFVKITSHAVNDTIDSILLSVKVPHAKVCASGKNDDGTYFIIEEFIESPIFKECFDKKSEKFIYERAFYMGSRYSKLRKNNPDKKVDEKSYSSIKKRVERVISEYDNFIEKHEGIEQIPEWNKLICLKDYFSSHLEDIKNNVMVYGNTDIHPSNFMLNDELIAVDFENTGYAEISNAIRWGLVSSDVDRQDKYYAFARGYLEGVFQFNIPVCVKKAIVCMFAFMAFREAFAHLKRGNIEKFSLYLKKIFADFKNEEIGYQFTFDISKIKLLNNLKKIRRMKGSYNANNLVFKCYCGRQKYLLKVMHGNSKTLDKYLYFYDMLTFYDIPSPKVFESGVLNEKYIFVLFEYIEGEEWHKVLSLEDYETGRACGRKIAQYFNRLQDVSEDMIPKFTIKNFNQYNLESLNIIFDNEEAKNVMPVSKETLISMLEKYSKDFEDEPLRLIHGDIKFGNIMSKDDKLYILDNENYCYSYEIVNFRYNLATKFSNEELDLKKGFYNGYFTEVYGEKIPHRLQGQAKYLVVSDLINYSRCYAEKISSNGHLDLHKKLFENGFYEKEINWLS